MDMTGEYRIPAPRQTVWKALNDPEVLRQSIPGCESVTATSPTELEAQVVAVVGPVKAKFKGKVTLSDIDPPNGYTLTGEGNGGSAGLAKGTAQVRLAEDGEFTVLTFDAKAQVMGKLAQIGSRLIDGTARKMADEFFEAFSRIAAGARAAEVEVVKTAAPPKGEGHGVSPMVWASGLIVLGLLVLWFLLG